MTRSLVVAALTLILMLTAGLVVAHSDMDKPVFVATSGIDNGRCLDPGAPCKTIGYALGRVGKGGQVRVAGGQYEISNAADIFQIVSGVSDIRGGFDRSDGFSRQGLRATSLIGVPHEYRDLLQSRGFHVIADRKKLDAQNTLATENMLKLHQSLQTSSASAPCVGGVVDGLACENADLLSHVAFADVSGNPGASADVWGFVDLNTNREYAIVGYNNGTAVFDVTDPASPAEIGFVDGQSTVWRDIKVYQFFNANEKRWNAYAYVTADGISEGLFIIDLSGLPQSIERVAYNGDFGAAHNVFAASTDFGTGLSLTGAAPSLIIAGSNNGGGRFRVYSLAAPESPAFVAIPNVSANDYMHDAASIIIRDARKDTQCVNASDYCEILFDFNESTVDVWDITAPANPVRLSRTPYANSAYTHSGWPSEDGQYLFVHDELDEQNNGLMTTVRTFSLADLTNPLGLVGTWAGPTAAIDHNGFVRGNRYYMSNYSRGLTILDISDPATLRSAGRLDTYPFSDSANFVGAWGVYPYFHSGNIAISDISSGFYMAGDNTLESASGRLSLSAASYSTSEGGALTITLQRNGGASGNVGVGVELVPASGDPDDFVSVPQSASWTDGDTADKSLVFTTLADGVDEGLERLLVNLVAPTNGAALGTISVASVYISEAGTGTAIEFDRTEITTSERGFAQAVVTFQRRGSASGAVSVDYTTSGADASEGSDFLGATTGTISWADGDANPKSIVFDIVDDGAAEADEFFELSLTSPNGGVLGANTSARITILDGSGANQAPNAIAGASQTVSSGATVSLNGASSNDPDGDVLTYQWSQILGPATNPLNTSSAAATFTAPAVASDTLLRFQLQVTDPSGLVDTATTNITVRSSTTNSNVGGGGGAISLLLTGLFSLLLFGRAITIRTDVA